MVMAMVLVMLLLVIKMMMRVASGRQRATHSRGR